MPDPVVEGPSGIWLEVSFLNRVAMASLLQGRYRTSPNCTQPWQNDPIGRPLLVSTDVLLHRAVQVGHPHDGLLNPHGKEVRRECARAVPRILHFVWVCSPVKNTRAQHVRGFAQQNPAFKIFFWTDTAVPDTEKEIFSSQKNIEIKMIRAEWGSFRSRKFVKEWEKSIKKNSSQKLTPAECTFKSHFWRVEVVYKYGGIYLDMDHIATRGFHEVGGQDLWRWPFVMQKVCGANIGNQLFAFDKGSPFGEFLLDAFEERCAKFHDCYLLSSNGPPAFAMAALRYNSSDMMFIGEQFFSTTGIAIHSYEHSWR